jgi:hypothetical protein
VIVVDAVKKWRKKRDARLRARGYRFDEEGEWRTTDNGHKILIKDGVVVGGSPFVIAGMGAPEGKDIPERSVKIKEHCPFSEDDSVEDAIVKRQDHDCVFGGFYKVATENFATQSTATFFNPYTGEYFHYKTRDISDERYEGNAMMEELGEIPINEKAQWCWRRSNAVVQEGDTVQVVKGRTLPHGLKAKVKTVRDYKNDYGDVIATYAYLDNGEKISVKNVKILEDGKLLDDGKVETKVAGKGKRKKTITLTESERKSLKDVADGITKDAAAGDIRGIRAKAKNFLKGMMLEITKDGKTDEYEFLSGEALAQYIGDSKDVTIKIK